MSYEKLSLDKESDPYRAGFTVLSGMPTRPRMEGPPSTPTTCAETPTHAAPSRISSVCAVTQSGAASTPPLTFSHSTTTVPLNFCGLIGR
jgi:hypothetical protein